MSAYTQALASVPEPIGASRSKPGSVAAAVAGYFASPAFKNSLAASSQVVRKAVLEAFRREHGDKQIAAMPKKFIAAMLDGEQLAAMSLA